VDEGVWIRSPSRASGGAVKALITARGLPADVLSEAPRRLSLAAAVVGSTFLSELVLNQALRAAGWQRHPHPVALDLIAIGMVAVSAALLAAGRWGRLDARLLLDLGLVYEVVVGFGIAMGDNLSPLSADAPLESISWICVLIVMFPLVVPATLGKTLLAAILTASMWPLAFMMGVLMGHPLPPRSVVLMNFLENYIAAALALAPAAVIGRLGAAVRRARRMGSYELVEPLGQGGMGEVWRARHQMLARPAAIKLIRPQVLGAREGRVAENVLRRFEREAQVTAALHSPHTIALYDFGVTKEGTLYYVMELLEGLDLDSLVRRFGPVPAERAVHFLLQACDSLGEAHQAGLVHRDVKPANLHACRVGLKHDFVKVLDFGLVKLNWEGAAESGALTTEGMAAGTPAYLAPEAALGSRAVDHRADIYSLGCVGYWLLTGQMVFPAEAPLEMMLHHLNTAPLPPSRRTELPIPEALDQVIFSCLEKDPDQRPPNAEALALQLAACALDSPWTPERAKRWWETHLPQAATARTPVASEHEATG
jgi:serine/threonine-protein kinase